jgi:hypothetical protein
MAQFYFAWVGATDTAFVSGFEREDEEIFEGRLSALEGDFATLDIVVINPDVGLLSSGRQLWAWLAYESDSLDVTPLFFGRLIGIPQNLQERLITLRFVARPADYEAAKAAAAEPLKILPYYDPVWITPEGRDDPDTVLEGRAARWHIDPVTHVVTASDIASGEDGTIDLADDYYADTLSIALEQTPLRRVRCESSVSWDQAASGSIDISAKVLQAFQAAGTAANQAFISSYTGGGLMADWPKVGESIGNVWEFGDCDITRYDGWRLPADYKQVVLQNSDIGNFPLWRMLATVRVKYDVSRRRTETVTFDIEADTQAIMTDPGESEQLILNLSSADVAAPIDPGEAMPIGDVRRRSYFLTDRGRKSIEALIAMARARMLARARAVKISFETGWDNGLLLSLRKNLRIENEHIPGGEATGKIVAYALVMNGDSGELTATVTIGCMIGKGATVSDEAGTGDYVDEDYAEDGWQTTTGGLVMPDSGDVTYADYSATPIVDDGLDLIGIDATTAVQAISVINGETIQKKVLSGFDVDYGPWFGESQSRFEDLREAVEAIEAIYTQVDLTLFPIESGPFQTDFALDCSNLMIAKTIDLEAAA